jgi:hypothetical protein
VRDRLVGGHGHTKRNPAFLARNQVVPFPVHSGMISPRLPSALVVGFVLAVAVVNRAGAETTPRGLFKVKGAPEALPPTQIASFAAG